jgi:cell division protein ZapC
MDFIPKPHWQWVYDNEQGKLAVVDRDRSFPLVYPKNMLMLPKSQTLPFTVEDVTRYIELFESNALSGFDEALRCKIILHLLAVDGFHKPIMPKSWLFEDAKETNSVYDNGEIVTLTAVGMKEQVKYMVLKQESNFCLCMLFDEHHLFSNNKTFKQFQLIKVTVNKLNHHAQSQSQEWLSFQNAG